VVGVTATNNATDVAQGNYASVNVGFVYLNGTMFDLNTLLNASGKGLTIASANNVNDFGQILATARNAAGVSTSVVLTVVGYKRSSVLK